MIASCLRSEHENFSNIEFNKPFVSSHRKPVNIPLKSVNIFLAFILCNIFILLKKFRLTRNLFETEGKTGLRTEPCGSPLVVSSQLDSLVAQITAIVRSVRKLPIHVNPFLNPLLSTAALDQISLALWNLFI